MQFTSNENLEIDSQLIEYAKFNELNSFKSLLEKNQFSIFTLEKSLRISCKYNSLDVFKYLLEKKLVDPSVKRSEISRYCCEVGNTKMAELLLEDKRVDISADNNFCIKIAAMNNNTELLSLIFKKCKLKINDNLYNELIIYVKTNDRRYLRPFLRKSKIDNLFND